VLEDPLAQFRRRCRPIKEIAPEIVPVAPEIVPEEAGLVIIGNKDAAIAEVREEEEDAAIAEVLREDPVVVRIGGTRATIDEEDPHKKAAAPCLHL